jgi:hypothetical protein
MKHLLKYLYLFLCLFVITYVIAVQFIANTMVNCAVSGVVSAGVIAIAVQYIQRKPFSYLFLVATFLLMIFVPLLGPKASTSLEKRRLASFPEFHSSNIWKFFKQYNDYFSDRFAFRIEWLVLIARMKMNLFGISSVPDKVAIGEDNWLFSAGPYYLSISSVPFTPEVLRLININLEIMTKWLADRNIKFYLLGVPMKGRIYPEKMPGDLRWLMAHSRIRQLFDYIKDNPKLKIIDITNELLEGKKVRPTYLKTDTHWNQFGAFLAYTKVMQTMKRDFPDLYIYDINEFKLASEISDGGDLMQCMGLSTGLPYEQYTLRLKSGLKPVLIDSSFAGDTKVSIREMKQSKNKQRLYVVHDSMTMFLRLFLMPSFQRSFYYWHTQMNIPLLLNEKPDIVLQEMAELLIARLVELPPQMEADTAFMHANFPQYQQIRLEAGIDPYTFE